MKSIRLLQMSVFTFALALGLVSCGGNKKDSDVGMSEKDNALLQKIADAGLIAIPTENLEEFIAAYAKDAKDNKTTPEKVELGKKLYFDPRLSASNLISCNTCHNLGLGGADLIPVAIGHKWQPNPNGLNSPTVYNSVFNEIQFWDGRAEHLAEQAAGPVQNPVEMAATEDMVVKRIESIPEYKAEFAKIYGDTKITLSLVASTIAVYERTLITPSAFDDYVNGDVGALSDEQKAGLELFIDKGCTACHTGVSFNGGMQTVGIAAPYKYQEVGGFKGNENDLIKIPTLRNVLETAPYFHNGQILTIEEAIQEMARIQLGIDLTKKEIASMKAFFSALTGRKPEIIYPQMPASTDTTMQPIFE